MNNPVENPWKMRLSHHGFAHLQLDWRGQILHFDPVYPPNDDEIVVLTWNWMSRLKGVVAAIQAGRRLHVVAPPEALDWLSRYGAFEGYVLDAQLNGVSISLFPYAPLSSGEAHGDWSRLKSVVKRPQRAIGRLWERFEAPDFSPMIAHLEFPSGARLLHMNLSINELTEIVWIKKMIEKFRGCDWLISGCDYQHDGAIIRHLPDFAPKHLLLADLIGDFRKGMGLPTQILTPVVDKLSNKGLSAHVFVSQASYRFDTIPIEAE